MLYKNKLKKFRINLSPREQVEPEEIFFDSSKIREFDEGETETEKLEKEISSRIFGAFSAFQYLVVVSFIVFTAFYVFGKGSVYSQRAADNSSRAFPVFAQRGIIYSADGRILAENKTYFDVFILAPKLPRGKNASRELGQLTQEIARAIGADEAEMEEKFESASSRRLSEASLFRGLEEADIIKLAPYLVANSYLEVRQTSRRKYLEDPTLSHIVGYTGEISSSELALDGMFARGERVGKMGVEAYYDELLRGESGVLIRNIDSQGVSLSEELHKEAQPGADVTLSIDAAFQEEVHGILRTHMKSLGLVSAVAIVSNPQDGGILALVSVPAFSANLFEDGISRAELAELIADPAKPLFNRAISGEYPSGSTIKPIIAAAALEADLVTPDFLVYSAGAIEVPSVYDPEVLYTFKDWKAHGWTDMRRAIADSVNVYFYTIAGGYKDTPGLGIQKIEEYLKRFGWGKTLGIDLPGEATGLIPTPKWKKEEKGENWFIGDTYLTSIGQGDILVTPLQVAAATAVFANNGTLYAPKILARIGDADVAPEVISEQVASYSNIQVVREGLRRAVTDGSSKALASLPVEVAGKTGTAQTGRARNHAWFTGFAPYEEPEVVVTVLLEDGDKSDYAVRVARDIFEAYFDVMPVR